MALIYSMQIRGDNKRIADCVTGSILLVVAFMVIPYAIVGYVYGLKEGYKFVTTGGAIIGGEVAKGQIAFLVILLSIGLLLLFGGIRKVCGRNTWRIRRRRDYY